MIKGPSLRPKQWKVISSGLSNIAQAVIIFSLAALFVPEAVGLPREFSRLQSLVYLICGFIIFGIGVKISQKGD